MTSINTFMNPNNLYMLSQNNINHTFTKTRNTTLNIPFQKQVRPQNYFKSIDMHSKSYGCYSEEARNYRFSTIHTFLKIHMPHPLLILTMIDSTPHTKHVNHKNIFNHQFTPKCSLPPTISNHKLCFKNDYTFKTLQ